MLPLRHRVSGIRRQYLWSLEGQPDLPVTFGPDWEHGGRRHPDLEPYVVNGGDKGKPWNNRLAIVGGSSQALKHTPDWQRYLRYQHAFTFSREYGPI